MSVTVYITVEDIIDRLLTYESIQLERADTVGGSYALVVTETLVAGQFYYPIADLGGDINKWYRYRFYHATGPVTSAYSDPFRVDGVSRLRARQLALSKYGGGIVVVESETGPEPGQITTVDHRVKTSLFRTGRGKGTWLLPATGVEAGNTRVVSDANPSAGTMTVLPVWATGVSSGDEIEWHWLADAVVWNDALNRGMARYFYVDRMPLKGVAGQEEYDLSSIPWIIDPEGQITDVTWYPTSGLDVEQSYVASGRWWKPRIDREKATLTIYPPVAATVTLYLYATRPMPPLHTDASAAPAVCAEELVAALAYDEVLAYLTRPRSGGADQRRTWKQQRRDHTPELRRLLWKHRPKPRYGRPRLPQPPVVPQPFRAR